MPLNLHEVSFFCGAWSAHSPRKPPTHPMQGKETSILRSCTRRSQRHSVDRERAHACYSGCFWFRARVLASVILWLGNPWPTPRGGLVQGWESEFCGVGWFLSLNIKSKLQSFKVSKCFLVSKIRKFHFMFFDRDWSHLQDFREFLTRIFRIVRSPPFLKSPKHSLKCWDFSK